MPDIDLAAGGETIAAYLATPEPAHATGCGVLVLQEWWGLVPHIRAVADRFAAHGFAAIAPDLYRGETASAPDDARRLLMALEIEQAEGDLRASIDALRERAGVAGKVGAVGFCMGGQLALYAAAENPDAVGAVVDFYGIHPRVQPDFARLRAPVLGLFGGRDQAVGPPVVEALANEIRARGGSFDYHIYPQAGHAFFNDTRADAYDAPAAQDAWVRTLRFLRAHLGA